MTPPTPPPTTPSRRALLPIAIVLGLVAALLLPAGEASALGKVKCDVSGQPAVAVGSYDPIVNHNSPGPSMHEHQFFGNTAWHSLANPNAANYADLAGKANNCRKVLGLSYSADSAGYWTPTLRYVSGPKTGQLVPAQQFTAYYRSASGVDVRRGAAHPGRHASHRHPLQLVVRDEVRRPRPRPSRASPTAPACRASRG